MIIYLFRICIREIRRPAVPRNSSRGGDHVLRGAHERNCACAPRLSLTPTHVTERRELFRRSLPLRSCRYGRYVRELHTRRWIRHKTPSESTVTTLRVASVQMREERERQKEREEGRRGGPLEEVEVLRDTCLSGQHIMFLHKEHVILSSTFLQRTEFIYSSVIQFFILVSFSEFLGKSRKVFLHCGR